jgi:hypothetical protein
MAETVNYANATIVVKDFVIYPRDVIRVDFPNLILVVVSFVASSNVNGTFLTLDSCLTWQQDLLPAWETPLFTNGNIRDGMIRLAFNKIKPIVDMWHARIAGIDMPDEVFEYTPL